MALKLKKLSSPESDSPRPDPAELVRAVRAADPTSPPARVEPKADALPAAEPVAEPTTETSVPVDPQVGLNIRVRLSTSNAVEAAAAARGVSMKVLVMTVLRDSGIEIAERDLRDRSAKRRKGEPKKPTT